MNPKKWGSFLKTGDLIGVIAPSSPCDPNRLQSGLKALEGYGFKYKLSLDPAAAYGKDTFLFSSDTAKNRADALRDLYLDNSIKAIIAARGAYGSMEMLPLIDFDAIKNNPKPLVGFSDVTALLNVIFDRTGVATVHGSMLTGAFAEISTDKDTDKDTEQSVLSLIELLKGEELNPFKKVILEKLNATSESSIEGVFKGGSLSVLSSLCGTPWMPNLDSAILFIEEVSEKPFRIHRMLMQLKLAGKLEQLKGVVFGEMLRCDHQSGPDVKKTITTIFADYKYPVYWGLPVGHCALNLPLVVGGKGKIDQGRIELY
ncbi:MAG: LD-carboxypeptidase [bacterium]|nr:LD-carboxypeptidase [bacterium]